MDVDSLINRQSRRTRSASYHPHLDPVKKQYLRFKFFFSVATFLFADSSLGYCEAHEGKH
jgi:hypothetical protein